MSRPASLDQRYVNWYDVGFTPDNADGTPGTTPVEIDGVQGVEIDPRGNTIRDAGDGAMGPTLIICDFTDHQVTVRTRNLATLHSFTPGQRGSFTATHGSAKGKATTGKGAYKLALANAVIENNPTGGEYRQFGEGRLVIGAEWLDGVTNPLTFTAV